MSISIGPNSGDSHNVSPYWFAAIVPFKYQITYHRKEQLTPSEAIETNPVIILDSEIVSWSVSGTKTSPTSTFSFQMLSAESGVYGTPDIMNAMNPNDWVLFWVFDNYSDYISTRQAVEKEERANYYRTAPKFMGRLDSIVRDLSVSATGQKSLVYKVSCIGFKEFLSKIYYNRNLPVPDGLRNAGRAIFGNEDVSLDAGGLLLSKGGSPLVPPDTIIPKLIAIVLGKGPGEQYKHTTQITTSPNQAFLIPRVISKWMLGNESGKTYADLLMTITGVQKYNETPFSTDIFDSNYDTPPPNLPFGEDFALQLLPTSLKPMAGKVLMQSIYYDNTPLWSVLATYLNAPFNEIYTIMRPNLGGWVMPTVVCRQIPFSTDAFLEQCKDATGFLELPRWRIEPSMLLHYQLGKSATTMSNYMQIIETNLAKTSDVNGSYEQWAFRPIFDRASVARNGLEAEIKNISALFTPIDNAVFARRQFWSQFMADITFDSQLFLSGSVLSKGIQLPIAHGDNIELDGYIYHIEAASHEGSISPNGAKDFNTMLTVSHGRRDPKDLKKDFLLNYIGINAE